MSLVSLDDVKYSRSAPKDFFPRVYTRAAFRAIGYAACVILKYSLYGGKRGYLHTCLDVSPSLVPLCWRISSSGFCSNLRLNWRAYFCAYILVPWDVVLKSCSLCLEWRYFLHNIATIQLYPQGNTAKVTLGPYSECIRFKRVDKRICHDWVFIDVSIENLRWKELTESVSLLFPYQTNLRLRTGHTMQHCVQYCAQCCRSRSKFYFCNISRNNCTVCPPHCTQCCTQCCIVCPVRYIDNKPTQSNLIQSNAVQCNWISNILSHAPRNSSNQKAGKPLPIRGMHWCFPAIMCVRRSSFPAT